MKPPKEDQGILGWYETYKIPLVICLTVYTLGAFFFLGCNSERQFPPRDKFPRAYKTVRSWEHTKCYECHKHDNAEWAGRI